MSQAEDHRGSCQLQRLLNISLLRWWDSHAGTAEVSQHGADGRERLQGELTVTRSIGDLPYRHVGLIAEPEFTTWRSVQAGAQQTSVILNVLRNSRTLQTFP